MSKSKEDMSGFDRKLVFLQGASIYLITERGTAFPTRMHELPAKIQISLLIHSFHKALWVAKGSKCLQAYSNDSDQTACAG